MNISEDWLRIYRKLVLIRNCEEIIRREYFKDEMKTPVHLGIGAEAIAVGVEHVLNRGLAQGHPERARFFGTYRNHALFLSVSEDTDSFFAELYGRETGCGKGKAGSMHLSHPSSGLIATSAVVASTIPVAVGSALTQQYLGQKGVSCVFFGDGAVEEGVFWESVNFACLRKLPILFVCEDNELAIHTHSSARRGFLSFKDVLSGFQLEFQTGDGSDINQVLGLTSSLRDEMARSGRPGFLHLTYHRFLEHVGPLEDFKFGYRARPEAQEERFDPVLKARRYLLEQGASEVQLAEIHEEVDEKIRRSVEAAREAKFPNPEELYTDVWA